jgi:formylglycine-generating enzyme required for sulfatase activity
MVVIPAGKFRMGTTDAELAALTASYGDHFKREAPQQEVTCSQPFAVGRFAVTFDEWEAAQRDGSWPRVTGLPPRQPSDEKGWGRGCRPVIAVSWDDAQAYVKWLSAKTGQTYRLLSEAEWEYACRAGSETAFWWGDTISASQANYDATNVYWGGSPGEYRKKTVPVDQFQPNPWGLYQMHGNVGEWCEDCWNWSYAGKPASLKATGGVWTTGDCSQRVLRGGSWYSVPPVLRSAYRSRSLATNRYGYAGFRVARTITP